MGTGRRAGRRQRSSGAAPTTARVALVRAGVAHQTPLLLLPTTAMPASRIGWQVGVPLRSFGAARTEERVARRKTEVVPRVLRSFFLGGCTRSKPKVLAQGRHLLVPEG